MDTQTSSLYRLGFGLKKEVQGALAADYYQSDLVNQIKQAGNCLARGRITIKLAKEFGFCYGVDKAVDFAYEARKQFPDKRIFLTTEIIHNPLVNSRLEQMGIRFLAGQYRAQHGFDDITAQDVVILPAFGTTVGELDELKKKGCILVDTTCGSVIHVWMRVEKYSKNGYTAVIHGKYSHEETCGTSSRALKFPGGRYLVVRDIAQAQSVVDYIVSPGDRGAFLKEFAPALSPDFDPDKDLIRVGLANQTTMLSSESLEIAKMFRFAMSKKYGAQNLDEHFQNFDTICSATQDRQDAVMQLLKDGVDAMVVIGGFNSSNTGHLCEIASLSVPTFHIQSASDMDGARKISHRDPLTHQIRNTENWLSDGSMAIGITAGASTPNTVIGEVIEKIFSCQ